MPSSSPSSTSTAHPCRLLSLPTEIRLQIWTHVLSNFPLGPSHHTHESPLPKVTLRYSPTFARHGSYLRLLLVCRPIHDEAFHLFYAQNTLCFSSPAQLLYFFSTLSPRRRAYVASICVAGFGGTHWTGDTAAVPAFSLLGLCPRLRYLRIELGLSMTTDILDAHQVRLDVEEVDEHARAAGHAAVPPHGPTSIERFWDEAGLVGARHMLSTAIAHRTIGAHPHLAAGCAAWWDALDNLRSLRGLQAEESGVWGLDPKYWGHVVVSAWPRLIEMGLSNRSEPLRERLREDLLKDSKHNIEERLYAEYLKHSGGVWGRDDDELSVQQICTVEAEGVWQDALRAAWRREKMHKGPSGTGEGRLQRADRLWRTGGCPKTLDQGSRGAEADADEFILESIAELGISRDGVDNTPTEQPERTIRRIEPGEYTIVKALGNWPGWS